MYRPVNLSMPNRMSCTCNIIYENRNEFESIEKNIHSNKLKDYPNTGLSRDIAKEA